MTTRVHLNSIGLGLLLSAFGFDVLSADCVTAPSGLVAWWRGENTALNTVGTNHGTLQNGVAFTAGTVGQAFQFDGMNDFVQVPNAPDLNPSAITLEAWVNPSTIKNDSRIVSKELQAGSCNAPYVAYSLDIRADQGRRAIFYFTTTNNASLNQVTGTSIIPINQFTHLAATYDGTTAKLYVNGVLEMTSTSAGPIRASAAPLTIGNAGAACRASFAGQVEFAGMIDEVSLYNRALMTNEIAAIFAAGSAGKCAAPTLKVRALPGAVRLSWTTNATGFALETNGPSFAPVAWNPLGATPVVVSNEFVLTNAVNSPARNYRLRKP